MMDEVNQPDHGSEGEKQRAGDRRHWSEWLWEAACCGKRCHAVKERSQEDAESPLGHTVSHEALLAGTQAAEKPWQFFSSHPSTLIKLMTISCASSMFCLLFK
jgi:hypothetical protein